jgi:hypothetical protein
MRRRPGFIQRHAAEHLNCFRQHFDVTLVTGDCDYQLLCETHRPDLALFESGVYSTGRRIKRVFTYPEVPKVGFCNADAYALERSVFLSDMERWGVDTFFTHSVAMAEYTPEIAKRLFVWPNFVDGQIYRDYGQEKNVPVLLTGSQATHYPWRNRIHGVITPHYPCLTTPHSGWFDGRASTAVVHGEAYARLINAAWVAPTCGTIAKEIVRKHFEIPACRSCLVTERTNALEAAGFEDMHNAVFAEPGDVLDKLNYLFSNPEIMDQISRRGFDLVHSRHTMAQRDQLFQWFTLHRLAAPDERIVQPGPFEPLRLVPSGSGAFNRHPQSGGRDRLLLHEGQRQLAAGRYEHAQRLFLRCLNYHVMPEPLVGLTRASLYTGNPAAAVEWITQPIKHSLAMRQAADPDPVEWSFLIRALLCQGKVAQAVKRARQFPTLSHPELDRMRGVVAALAEADAGDAELTGRGSPRPSVHQLPELGVDAWMADLRLMLRACKQERLADVVPAAFASSRQVPALSVSNRPQPGQGSALDEVRPVVTRLFQRLVRRLKRELENRVRREAAGSPLASLRSLLEKEDIHHVLLIGASAAARCTRAVVAALRGNPNSPQLVWLRDATPALLRGRGQLPGERVIATGAALNEPDGTKRRFELVVVGGDGELDEPSRAALSSARFVVLTGINRLPVQRIHGRLRGHPEYQLITHHATDDNGYSAFRRLSAVKANRDAEEC